MFKKLVKRVTRRREDFERARREGYNALNMRESLDSCPYEDQEMREPWLAGWRQAEMHAYCENEMHSGYPCGDPACPHCGGAQPCES